MAKPIIVALGAILAGMMVMYWYTGANNVGAYCSPDHPESCSI